MMILPYNFGKLLFISMQKLQHEVLGRSVWINKTTFSLSWILKGSSTT